MRSVQHPLLVVVALAACFGPLEPGAEMQPPCFAPAPLDGSYDARAPEYIVMFTEGVAASHESARLAKRYAFSLIIVYESIGGFAAELHPWVVAQVRCERTVASVSRNGILHTAAW